MKMNKTNIIINFMTKTQPYMLMSVVLLGGPNEVNTLCKQDPLQTSN